jgi:carbon starvation protein
MKIFSPKAAGFLPAIKKLAADIASGTLTAEKAKAAEVALFNARVDVGVTGLFLALVTIIIIGCALEWYKLLRGTKRIELKESPYVPLPDAA